MLQRRRPDTGALKENNSDEKSTKVENVKIPPASVKWQNWPHFLFGEVMTMMGRESLQALQKCRQVCQSWNMMISQMTMYDKAIIIREAESLAAKIREKWRYPGEEEASREQIFSLLINVLKVYLYII